MPTIPEATAASVTRTLRGGKLSRVWILRQLLHPLNVVDSMEFMLDKLGRTENNAEFLASMSG